MTLNEKLNHIRKVLDIELCQDIESIMGKATQISGVYGLSAECKAQAKKLLELARLRALNELEGKTLPPSILSKAIDAHCSEELAAYEYADRLCASVSHQSDLIRSMISYEKEERNREMFNGQP